MFHPLVSDLSALTDDELSAKISELSQKISTAYRLGSGNALMQLQLIMNHHQEEYQRRAAKKVEEMQKNSSSFKKIIDIK